jgi:hypothetical protein
VKARESSKILNSNFQNLLSSGKLILAIFVFAITWQEQKCYNHGRVTLSRLGKLPVFRGFYALLWGSTFSKRGNCNGKS